MQLGLPLVREFGLASTLLLGARLLVYAIGGQSWGEGLLLFPDFGLWLWAISLLLLLTGAIRVMLILRGVRHGDGVTPGV